ncbi:hydroxypyruvate isomerase [Paracoccus isoporae]|uniref:Hydroxypyruvate isomerase n=1 Tax=Paracoccus isoporae TaxID=591205 RepID=A0A1G6XLW9_9RHOB|nr:TIM barrel protein [Paracoccus isoporae]SDD79032.1 hydroxypyruvate isomerase [Paracoccus isoporae]
MPRFAANLTMLFNELPMLQRFGAARRAGFKGVEILFPYDIPLPDMRASARRNRMEIVLINCPPPNWAGGPLGFAAIPERKERFRRDFERALRVAEALSVRHIHIMSGKAEGAAALDCFIDNLRWAAGRAPHAGLTIEPINPIDMPGYFMSDFDLAETVLDAVAAPNLGLQFDAYHAHRITGDVIGCWRRHGHRAHHIQIAGMPGRHEPVDGEINYTEFFQVLAEDGYDGWVSAEYAPRTLTEAGLRWLQEFGKAQGQPPQDGSRPAPASRGRPLRRRIAPGTGS